MTWIYIAAFILGVAAFFSAFDIEKQEQGPIEEGDDCPDKKCRGVMEFEKPVNCSCHIRPPCSACTNVELVCNRCLITEDEWREAA